MKSADYGEVTVTPTATPIRGIVRIRLSIGGQRLSFRCSAAKAVELAHELADAAEEASR